ncbi:unnamed protein product [Phytomonas sp. EM1]|nr:unnamed protein product [Phytomonas sp. EM1]|eukprot:CCW59986.1 unnamed protein product [Phytomonas sp. isolate EM1]
MDVFSSTTLSQHTPLVVVVFNDEDSFERKNVWEPLINKLSDSLHDFLIKVGYVTSQSEVGQSLKRMYGFQSPAIIFFDGFLEAPPSNSSILTKLPKFFTGELDFKSLLRWILQSISPDFITRLDHENDLFDWFRKLPQYSQLPRILYFTKEPYVGPVYRVLSQIMQQDAVFGVVVNAFEGDPNKKVLAQRYNISQESELPAFLVLHRRDGGKTGVEDEVHRLQTVTKKSTVHSIMDTLLKDLPDASANVMRESGERINPKTIEKLWERRLYILREVEKERKEILNWMEKETSQPSTSYNPPVEVRTQAEWEKNFVVLSKGHQCLIVFSEPALMENATSILKGVADKIVGSTGSEMLKRLHFVVVDAAVSGEVMRFFGADPSGLPAVVLLMGEAQMYFNFDGSFSEDHLVDFYQINSKAQTASAGKSFSTRKMPPLSVPKGEPLTHPSENNQKGNEGDL